MKIKLPDGQKIELDENISIDKKIDKVKKLLNDYMFEIENNWNSNSIKYFLDGLSNYLVWHKEKAEKGKEDKDILSIKKIEEMIGKRKSKSMPFSSISTRQKEDFGLDGAE